MPSLIYEIYIVVLTHFKLPFLPVHLCWEEVELFDCYVSLMWHSAVAPIAALCLHHPISFSEWIYDLAFDAITDLTAGLSM